jgi:uncharacterized protein (DUF697 family)
MRDRTVELHRARATRPRCTRDERGGASEEAAEECATGGHGVDAIVRLRARGRNFSLSPPSTDELARRPIRCHAIVVKIAEFWARTWQRLRRRRDEDPTGDRARNWVHAYAVGGAAFALVPIPIPGSTTAGLVTIEATMIHAIARIYDQELHPRDAAAIATGLEVAGGALKTVARSAVTRIPGIGGVIRATLALLTIEAIGRTMIAVMEKKKLQAACTVFPNGATLVP